MEEPHDPRHVRGRSADGKLVSADVKVHVRELFFNEPQRFIMAAEGLNHLVGVVEEDYFGADARECMGKLPRSALAGDKPALSIS
jgi:hypothetical protein